MTPTQKIIAQGAEAIILKEKGSVTKRRIKKSYRISEIDERIRKLRTRSETKLLEKAGKLISIPKITKSDENQKEIIMEFIDGEKLSDHLDNFPLKKQKQICKQIGENVAKLHDLNIIHGDLTTSNMILVEKPINKIQQSKKTLALSEAKSEKLGEASFEPINMRELASQIYFIDFGLGFISHKFEDKAVDIHLLRQALEAKHFKNWEILFKEFVKGYKKSKDSEIVLERLKAVEKRGRYKH